MRHTMHVYTRHHEDATRYNAGSWLGEEHWIESKPNKLLWAWCCLKKRPARNLTVQAFYDSIRFWCRTGKGCKAAKPHMRFTRRRAVEYFFGGKSFLATARKFHRTTREIEAIVRGWPGMPRVDYRKAWRRKEAKRKAINPHA